MIQTENWDSKSLDKSKLVLHLQPRCFFLAVLTIAQDATTHASRAF